jgi:hypothetical protein
MITAKKRPEEKKEIFMHSKLQREKIKMCTTEHD